MSRLPCFNGTVTPVCHVNTNPDLHKGIIYTNIPNEQMMK